MQKTIEPTQRQFLFLCLGLLFSFLPWQAGAQAPVRGESELYFHWGPENHILSNLQKAGPSLEADRRSSRVLNSRLIDFLFEVQADASLKEGEGLYVSTHPTNSSNFGPRLMIAEVRPHGPQRGAELQAPFTEVNSTWRVIDRPLKSDEASQFTIYLREPTLEDADWVSRHFTNNTRALDFFASIADVYLERLKSKPGQATTRFLERILFVNGPARLFQYQTMEDGHRISYVRSWRSVELAARSYWGNHHENTKSLRRHILKAVLSSNPGAEVAERLALLSEIRDGFTELERREVVDWMLRAPRLQTNDGIFSILENFLVSFESSARQRVLEQVLVKIDFEKFAIWNASSSIPSVVGLGGREVLDRLLERYLQTFPSSPTASKRLEKSTQLKNFGLDLLPTLFGTSPELARPTLQSLWKFSRGVPEFETQLLMGLLITSYGETGPFSQAIRTSVRGSFKSLLADSHPDSLVRLMISSYGAQSPLLKNFLKDNPSLWPQISPELRERLGLTLLEKKPKAPLFSQGRADLSDAELKETAKQMAKLAEKVFKDGKLKRQSEMEFLARSVPESQRDSFFKRLSKELEKRFKPKTVKQILETLSQESMANSKTAPLQSVGGQCGRIHR